MAEFDLFETLYNVSNEHREDFFTQEQNARDLEIVLKQTQCLVKNVTEDLELFACGRFTELIYSTPIVDNGFDVFENEKDENKKSILVFVSPSEAKGYCEKAGKELLFFRLDDLLIMADKLEIEKFIFVFKDGRVYVDEHYIRAVLNVDFTNNINKDSVYEVSDVSSSYNEIKDYYNENFKKYSIFKKMWLAHIKEFKDKNEYAENGNYEPEYDVIVADMPNCEYINMREYIQSIVYRYKKEVIKVVLLHSDLGRIVENSTVEPFFVNE